MLTFTVRLIYLLPVSYDYDIISLCWRKHTGVIKLRYLPALAVCNPTSCVIALRYTVTLLCESPPSYPLTNNTSVRAPPISTRGSLCLRIPIPQSTYIPRGYGRKSKAVNQKSFARSTNYSCLGESLSTLING